MRLSALALKKVLGDGKVFTVVFVKKDGSIRKMNARLGVKKGVKGVGMSFDPYSKNLLPVYDMQKKGFRMINADTLIKITHKGVTYNLEQDEK